MITFREKWLWALCLAILVHVGFFFIFYMNVDEEDAVPVTNNRVNTALPSAVSDVSDDLPPSIAKTYTATTTEKIESVSYEDTAVTQHATTQKPVVPSNTDKIRASQNLTEDSVVTSAKPVSTLKERAQKIEVLRPQKDEISASMPLGSVEALENMKTRAGLLSIDIPTEQPHVKIDKDYLSVKSEVEEINSQLSAAINEVKKRNQQKIDEAQQLRNGANPKEDQDVKEMSEQAVQDDSL